MTDRTPDIVLCGGPENVRSFLRAARAWCEERLSAAPGDETVAAKVAAFRAELRAIERALIERN